MDRPKVYDQQGQERDWDWLLANFGAIELSRSEAVQGVEGVYRIVTLQDAQGPAAQIVVVSDAQGRPLEGVIVVRYWPGAPPLPSWSPPVSMWRDRGAYGPTNVRGEIGFGMGRGDYYFPPSGGASEVWVADSAGPSDRVGGLGMLAATEHRHLDLYFRFEPVQAPPPTPPPTPAPPPPTPTPLAFTILDKDGQARDGTWLEHHFGKVEHFVAPEAGAYRLVELRHIEGVDECRIRVQDQGGRPAVGVAVSFRRRDGTAGSSAETGEDGIARFPLESDAKYSVPGQGPYLARVKKTAGNSDVVVGLGRVLGTSRHLDATFRLDAGQAPPAPPKVDARWREVFQRLDAILTVLEKRSLASGRGDQEAQEDNS